VLPDENAVHAPYTLSPCANYNKRVDFRRTVAVNAPARRPRSDGYACGGDRVTRILMRLGEGKHRCYSA
jgi:hypothetical protein